MCMIPSTRFTTQVNILEVSISVTLTVEDKEENTTRVAAQYIVVALRS